MRIKAWLFAIFVSILIIGILIYRELPGIVTENEIREISVLEFSSDKTLKNLLKNKNKERLVSILYLAIAVSADNCANSDTTRTTDSGQYKYKYIFVYDTHTDVLQKDIYKLFYDPFHPDRILSGDNEGYVKYPDIDKYAQADNIYKMLDLLRL